MSDVAAAVAAPVAATGVGAPALFVNGGMFDMIEGVAELGWLEMVARLLLAALLGGLLGLEREFDGQDAGFRTHLLVVLGSALFAVLSVGGFDQFVTTRNDTNVSVDVTRMAAYVAPGIGFIGGGAILKYGGRVIGITTAATLWTAAAIGIAAGLGAWESAVAATVLTLFALEALQPISTAVGRRGRRRRAHITVEVDREADVARIVELLEGATTGVVKELSFGQGPQDRPVVAISYWQPPTMRELVAASDSLRALDGVIEVSLAES